MQKSTKSGLSLGGQEIWGNQGKNTGFSNKHSLTAISNLLQEPSQPLPAQQRQMSRSHTCCPGLRTWSCSAWTSQLLKSRPLSFAPSLCSSADSSCSLGVQWLERRFQSDLGSGLSSGDAYLCKLS